jgi:hypothetical protein
MTFGLKRLAPVAISFAVITALCGAILTASFIRPIPIGKYTLEDASLITSIATSRISSPPSPNFTRVTITRMHVWRIFPALPAASVALWWWSRRNYPAGHCQRCGYNLTGNVSGACSECGATIADLHGAPK